MNNKKMLIIILLISVIFSIQVVAAGEVGSDDTIDADVLSLDDTSIDLISKSDTNDTPLQAGEGSFADLENDISGTDVELTRDYTYSSTDSGSAGIIISEDKTIDGKGIVTIDADHKSRIFNIQNGATVRLIGITFINANANGDGGAILSNGNVILENCIFEDNTASGNGGAILVSGSDNTITDCIFMGNTASGNGGAINWVSSTDSCTIVNSDFTNNIAHGSGGAIYLMGTDSTILNSNFTANYARGDGGAISLASGSYNANMDNCYFTNNSCGDDGGAINWQANMGTISNIVCYNNTGRAVSDSTASSTSKGGTICLTGDDVTITKSRFELGAVYYNRGKLNETDAGAIFVTGSNTLISHSVFVSCFSPNVAGAIKVIGNHTLIDNCTFENCSASEDGGAVHVNGTDCKIYNSTFTNNFAGDDGGAIRWDGNYGKIYNINCTNNRGTSASGSSSGGTIMLAGNYVSIDKSIFRQTYSKISGGAIFITGNYVNITDSLFDNCNVSHDSPQTGKTYQNGGGAIYILGDNVNIVTSNFTDANGREGGAVYIQGKNATIDGVVIQSSYSSVRGGAIFIEGQYASIKNSFVNNTYVKSPSGFTNTNLGGAIFIKGDNADISYSNFELSVAGSGGAIYSVGSHSTVYKSNFTNNLAHFDGGAIYWQGESSSVVSKYNTVDGCTFTGNTAYAKNPASQNTEGGGAIYWSEKGQYGVVKNSNFTNNSVQTDCKADGGAILWDKSYHGIVDNCIFDGNFATSTMTPSAQLYVQGGALFLRANDNYTVSNCIFKNSVSDKEGGAMYLSLRGQGALNPNGVRIINVTFINNTAKGILTGSETLSGGGAVFIKDSTNNIHFDNVTFINNSAVQGGAISYYPNNNNDVVDFNRMTFINNTASEEGGSIYVIASTLRISNSTFIGGSANLGGGIYSKVNIIYNNLTFINNTAYQGGALYWFRNSANTISDIAFINNTAYEGGALYLPNAGTNTRFTVSRNNFTNNYADFGGAIYVGVDKTTISNNNFTSNSAVLGGAIYVPHNKWGITISDSDFRENHAYYGGAINLAVYAVSGDGTSTTNKIIRNSNFTNNTAEMEGGAIYVDGSYQQIINCIFNGNNATEKGGAVCVAGNLESTIIRDSTFKNSHAENGGAIYKYDSDKASLKLNYDSFVNNTATKNGGAVLYIASGIKYRDYEKFDGHAVILANNLTDMYTTDQLHEKFITSSYFDWESNKDYPFVPNPEADPEAPIVTVYLFHPSDADFITTYMIVNVTNVTTGELIEAFTEVRFNPETRQIYVLVDEGLRIGQTYTFSIGFEDKEYMYKEYRVNITATGNTIGEFQMLQNKIENDIYIQRMAGYTQYIIILNRTYTFTWDTINDIYDEKCINLTDIDNPIILDFNGFEVNARGFCRIFNITASDVTILNAVLINGNASGNQSDNVSKGGAIFWAGDSGQLENVTFENNYAEIGGAVYYNSTAVDATIINSTFINNTAESFGGAIDCSANMELYNSTFESNHADTGAALCMETGATGSQGSNNEFLSNVALSDGGAIAFINASDIAVDTYFFYNNTAANGGAIYVDENSRKIDIINSTFVKNSADEGGAVSIEASDVTLSGSEFYENNATNGGAVYIGGSGEMNKIQNSIFTDNIATENGAGICWNGSAGEIAGSEFYNNTAANGGAIYLTGEDTKANIINSTFKYNNATKNGGAIDCNAENIGIYNITFNSNYAGEYGAALCVESGEIGNIAKNNTFKNNHAGISGGAIALLNVSNIDIDYGHFIENTANVGGGAVYVAGGSNDCTLDYCDFTGNSITNTTGGHGGAIYIVGDAINVLNSNFTDNEASYGGAIFVGNESADTTITHVLFDKNTADVNGGAILITGSGVVINDTLFQSNIAGESGGAAYVDGEGTTNAIYHSVFDDNKAGSHGGAIYGLANYGTVSYSNFTNNQAVYGGAISLNNASSNARISNVRFENNHATKNGGAIDDNSTGMELNNAMFVNNEADEYGGGLCAETSATKGLGENNTFIENDAGISGGAIAWLGASEISIDNYKFINNTAVKSGGAIFVSSESNEGNVSNSYFENNYATDFRNSQGGAIDWHGDNAYIYNATFVDSFAVTGGSVFIGEECDGAEIINSSFKSSRALGNGGSIVVCGNDITIDGSNFTDSRAIGDGGAIYLNNANAVVKNSQFTNTQALSGNGGAIYASGICTFENNEFRQYSAAEDYAGAIYVDDGTSTISDSTFVGPDTIRINHGATAYVSNNNITGDNPNKHITYLTEKYDARYNKYDYSIWNDGDLYLENNTFDYIIFNNGTIHTPTTVVVIDNNTWNGTWNTTFKFWVNITDDNNNTVISVDSLYTFNDYEEPGTYHHMPYNYLETTLVYQGIFTIHPKDDGLVNPTKKDGTIRVKMPTMLTITYDEAAVLSQEDIPFSIKISVPYESNFTFNKDKLSIKINGIPFYNVKYTTNIVNSTAGMKWVEFYVNFTEHHMDVGSYTLTVDYDGDDYHLGVNGSTEFAIFSRPIWIAVHADDIFYGQVLQIEVTSNATNTVNGRIVLRIDGKDVSIPLQLDVGGNYTYYLPNENFTDLLEPGNHTLSVMFYNDTYYAVQTNTSNFTVKSLNTTINATPTNITFGENEIINVTVNENATGYVEVIINGAIYRVPVDHGVAQFNISGLGPNNYTDIPVIFYPDNTHFNGIETNISFTVGPTDDYNISVYADNITYGQNATVQVVLPNGASGNVTISIDGKLNETVDVQTDGVARWINIPLDAGLHNITVHYNGCDYYAPGDANSTIFVGPAQWTPVVEVEETVYGDNITFNVTVPKDLNSTYVNLTIENTTYQVPITGGKGSYTIDYNINAGVHNVTLTFSGNARYEAVNYTTQYYIDKLTPNIELNRTDDNVVEVTVDGNSTGNVTFIVNGVPYTVNLTDGKANITGKLSVGDNNVVVIYNPDGNHNSVTTFANYTLGKLDALVNVTADNVTYGNPVIITVQVGENQTGYVSIIVNDVEYYAKLNSQGKAVFTVYDLEVGSYIVNVTYDGDNIYLNATNHTSFSVTPANMSAVVSAQNVTVEENPSFVIDGLTPRDYEGSVRIIIDGKVYYDGEISSVIAIEKILKAGNYTANVTFYGNKNYNNKTYLVNFTVSRVDPTIDVTIEDVTYPNNAVALVNVSAKANGTIEIYEGTKLVGSGEIVNGVASIDLITLAGGNHEVTVKFISSDDFNNNVSTTAEFTVNKADTSVTIVRNGTDVIAVVTPGVTGEVTFYINGEEFTNVTVNGNATIKGILHIGNNTVSVIYRGNENYTGSDNATILEIAKQTTDLSVVATPEVIIGENTTITVTMVNVTSGIVLIEVNGYNYTVDINDGEAVLVIALPAGEYNATAYYLGDLEHEASTNVSSTFVVIDKIIPEINITAPQTAIVGETVVIPVSTNGYNLTVWINGVKQDVVDGQIIYNVTSAGINTIHAETTENKTVYAANKTVVFFALKNNATLIISEITFTPTTSGNYTIVVESKETEMYYAGFNSTTFEVIKCDAPVDIIVGESYYVGDSFNITIVNETTAVVTINGVNYTVENGKIIIPAYMLPAGHYIVTATINGDNKYLYNSTTKEFDILRYNSTVNVTINPINVGDVAVIEITVPDDIDATVKVNVNGTIYWVDIVGGTGSLEVKGLKAGTYPVNVTYLENDRYLSSFNDSARIIVSKVVSSVTVNVNNITVGDVALVNITVISGASGNVTIKIGDEFVKVVGITDGKFSIAVPGLSVGNKTVVVTYNGDDKYLPSSNSANFTVARTTGVINLVVENITYGEVETIVVFVNATGNVTIKLNGDVIETVDLDNGKAEYSIPGLDAGNYSVEVIYNGNTDVDSLSTSANFTVDKIDPEITIEVQDIIYGDVEYIVVHVNADGNVTIKVNGEIVNELSLNNGYEVLGASNWNVVYYEGNATVEIHGLDAGKYPVEVTYNGNSNFNAKTLNASFNVYKANTTISLEIEDTINWGETQVINITVDNVNATGNVTIEVDGVAYNVPLIDGRGNFTTDVLGAGNHTVVAIYEGDVNFNGNWSSGTFVVLKEEAPFNVTVDNVDSGEDAVIKIVGLPDDATGYVIINVNGTEYGLNITNSRELSIPIYASGKYVVNATYLGDDKYETSNASTTFNATRVSGNMTVNVSDAVAGGDLTVTVTLPADAQGNITVTVGNTTKIVNATGGENTIVISNMSEGEQDVVVSYSGDGKYDPQEVTEHITVRTSINAEDLRRGWNSSYDFEAEFLDKQGHVLANTEVQFVVNGVTYTATTDEKGIARLTTSHLDVGTYDVTCVNTVTGQEVTKKATIVKRLIGNKDITMDYYDGTYYVVRAIGDDGLPVGAGEYVAISVNGVKYAARTDSNGFARLKINLLPRTYTIEAEYKNTKVSNKLVVKPVLFLVKPTITVKKGSKLVLQAKLKSSDGKPLIGKQITFRFYGQNYVAKTNRYGIATVTVDANVVKKLTSNAKYKYSARYMQCTVKGIVIPKT